MEHAIAVFGYKRPKFLINCLKSLEQNKEAVNYPVHIFIDGPKNQEEFLLVKECLSVAEAEWNFKSVTVIEQFENLGLRKSIRNGLDLIFEKFDSVVVVEDDLILHEEFLNFMILGLEKYSSFCRVASIQGFSLIESTSDKAYFIPGADSWGWATWKDRWESIIWDSEFLLNEIIKEKREQHFNFENSYNFLHILKQNSLGLLDSWAIDWQASMFLSNRVSLYPPFNLVVNKGDDDASTHTSVLSRKLPGLSMRELWEFPESMTVDSDMYMQVVEAYDKFIPPRQIHRHIVRRFRRIISPNHKRMVSSSNEF